jgi:hypothetical protein
MDLTLDQIRTRGFEVLCRELGPDGFIRFMQQFDHGSGNYAKERRAWVNKTSLDDIRRAAAGRKRPRKKKRPPG